MPGLRRHERAEAHLGVCGRVGRFRGTPPRAFERLRVRWRLQLSGLTFLASPEALGAKRSDLPRPAGGES